MCAAGLGIAGDVATSAAKMARVARSFMNRVRRGFQQVRSARKIGPSSDAELCFDRGSDKNGAESLAENAEVIAEQLLWTQDLTGREPGHRYQVGT